jgi:hypothetical protein
MHLEPFDACPEAWGEVPGRGAGLQELRHRTGRRGHFEATRLCASGRVRALLFDALISSL